jgi:hypothetical protein
MGHITSTISAKEEVLVLVSVDVLGVYLAARCSPHNHFTVTTPCPEKLRIHRGFLLNFKTQSSYLIEIEDITAFVQCWWQCCDLNWSLLFSSVTLLSAQCMRIHK